MYNKMGKPLPQGWALGANGQESTDAPDVLANIVAKKGGGIMPLGGNKEVNGSHKGYGYGYGYGYGETHHGGKGERTEE